MTETTNFRTYSGYVKEIFIPDHFDLVALGAEYCKPATGRDKALVATMKGFIDGVIEHGQQNAYDLDIRCPDGQLHLWLRSNDTKYAGNKLHLHAKRGVLHVPHAGLLLPSYHASMSYLVRGHAVPLRPMQDDPVRNCRDWEMPEAQLNHARFYLGLPPKAPAENTIVRIPVVAAEENALMDA